MFECNGATPRARTTFANKFEVRAVKIYMGVRFQVFATVTMKYSSSVMLRLLALVRTDVSEEHSVLRLLVTANIPSSPIPVTLMMEAIHPSKTSVFTRATRHNIPEDGILHSHRRGNFKSYIALTGWTL
jgi:hypothetical protein